jgi:iron complex transport system substrate-binding protein
MIKNIRAAFAPILIAAALSTAGCAADTRKSGLGNGWRAESSMELKYAQNFSADYYEGGYVLIEISDGARFLVVPEDREVPSEIADDIVVLKRPINNIYLVATASMCLFDALGALENIGLSGTKAEDWYIENARAAMQSGDILYAGKYSAPDYELIISNGCDLAVESTMISHAPEVKEKLEDIGIPVLIDQSSYESHPLGRTEWIKLYSALVGKEDLAKRLFDEQAAYLDDVAGRENVGKTVAFFYISSSGLAVARKSGDYVAKMIELAGGKYVFENLGDPESASSSVTLEMEEFYATAKDADYIIYNSSIGGELYSIEELVSKNALLKDFKAVRNGDVWCVKKNLYQETTRFGLFISDIRRALTEDDADQGEPTFMYKLR